MNKLNKNEHGFSIIEWLLLLLLILILFFVGWYVLQSKKKTEESQKNAANAQSEPAKSEKKTTTKQPVAEDYLKIPELGIKVKLSTNIKDAYYYINPNVKDVAYLSLASLKGTQCAADKISIAAVGKNLKTDHYNDDPGNQTYEQMAQSGGGVVIGNYAYTVSQAQAYCIDDQNSTDFKKADTAQKAFLQAAKDKDISAL